MKTEDKLNQIIEIVIANNEVLGFLCKELIGKKTVQEIDIDSKEVQDFLEKFDESNASWGKS